MRIRNSLLLVGVMFASALLWSHAHGQDSRLYTLGAASVLQTIDVDDLSITDHVTLVPSMSDIAFHPDGNLYGVNENKIYLIDTITGASEIVYEVTPGFGWLLGLAIDHRGQLYLSALNGDSDYLLRVDLETPLEKYYGSIGLRHWDLEFHNGNLYASGGTDNTDEGFIIQVDTNDLDNCKVIMDIEAQAYGLSAFNSPCGTSSLYAPTHKAIKTIDPEGASFVTQQIDDPLYFVSAGAATRSSYLGSMPALLVDSVVVQGLPCDGSGTVTVLVNVSADRPGIEFSLDGTTYQSTNAFDNVSPGTYQAFVRDSLGCTNMSEPFEVRSFNPDYTVDIGPAHCDQDNGTLQVRSVNSSDGLSFSLDGVTFSSELDESALSAGTLTLIIQNDAGCVDTLSVEIPLIDRLEHTLSSEPEHCAMEDGQIHVAAAGGMPPYRYSLVALPDQTEPVFSDLHAGTYSVRTTDELGCVVQNTVGVDSAGGPTISEITVDAAHCGMADGSAEITAQSDGQLLYTLNGVQNVDNGIFNTLEPGVYQLSIRDDFGCTTDTSFAVATRRWAIH